MKIIIKETFNDDYITREAGERLRNMILSCKDKIIIDFSSLKIASTSFFDEAFAKLSEEIDQRNWKEYIEIINIHELDKKLLIQIAKARGVELF